MSVYITWHFNNMYTYCPVQATHGHSQLKPKKLGVGPFTENLLKQLNYLLAKAHLQLQDLLTQSHNVHVMCNFQQLLFKITISDVQGENSV